MTELKVEPLITQEEMAEILHCHTTQVSMLREVGILPAIRTGKNYMFTMKTYNNFINNYEGLDVSNKLKAMEAKKQVYNRIAAN